MRFPALGSTIMVALLSCPVALADVASDGFLDSAHSTEELRKGNEEKENLERLKDVERAERRVASRARRRAFMNKVKRGYDKLNEWNYRAGEYFSSPGDSNVEPSGDSSYGNYSAHYPSSPTYSSSIPEYRPAYSLGNDIVPKNYGSFSDGSGIQTVHRHSITQALGQPTYDTTGGARKLYSSGGGYASPLAPHRGGGFSDALTGGQPGFSNALGGSTYVQGHSRGASWVDGHNRKSSPTFY